MNIVTRIRSIALRVAADVKVVPPDGKRRDWKIVYPDGSVKYSPTKPSEQPSEKPSGKKPNRKPGNHDGDVSEIGKMLKKELGQLPEGAEEAIREEVESLSKVGSPFTEEEMALPPGAGRQKVNTEEDVFKQAEEARESMLTLLDRGKGLDSRIGAKHIDGAKGEKPDLDSKGPLVITAPLKGRERSREKVNTDYKGDWTRLRDVVRASIAVDDCDGVKDVMSELRKSGIKIVEQPKDRFSKPTPVGYRDIALNVEYPNGHVGEIQVNVKSMLKAKKVAHKDYEVVRSIEAKAKEEGRKEMTPEESDAVDKANMNMSKIYEEAWRNGMRTSSVKVAAKTRYFNLDGNPVVVVERKFPVMTVKGEEVVLYDFFKLMHEGEEISQSEYRKLLKTP